MKLRKLSEVKIARLSEEERREVLSSRISYYPSDLAVIGWNAAFLYDTAAGAETTIQLLEYANCSTCRAATSMKSRLDGSHQVYQSLDKGTGFMARWAPGPWAARLHTLLLDVVELTERTDNSIKFLSDKSSARLYCLAAKKLACWITRAWSSKRLAPRKIYINSWSINSIRAAPSSSN